MVSILQAIILGIVQGITEWLPISSSGHLVIFQYLFGLQPPVVFDIILHMGSLVVVFYVFWKDIKELVIGVLKREKKHLTYLLYLVIASIPIALVGFFLNSAIKSIFHSLKTVGFSLLFTALILFLSQYRIKKKNKLNANNVFLIGIMQSLAILPGVSRSGSTIATGLILGIEKRKAAAFSFLMFIPAITGATLLEIGELASIQDPIALLIGTITTILVGIISLKWLLRILESNKFHYFAYYCLVLAILVFTLAFA